MLLLTYTARVETVDGHRVFVQIVHDQDCRHGRKRLRLGWNQREQILAKGFGTVIHNAGHRPDRSMWRNGRCCNVDEKAVAESGIICVHCDTATVPHDCTACGPVCADCLRPQRPDHHAPRGHQHREHENRHGEYEDCTANV